MGLFAKNKNSLAYARLFLLDFDEDGEDHRSAFGLLEEEQTDLVAQFVFEVGRVDVFALSGIIFDDKADLLADLHEQIFVIL